MPLPTPARIQQQMYTRERRGVFRSTEGYDTIALSAGLDSQLVKKQLHPYCVYDAPAELAGRGEKDQAAYPETMHALRLEGGDLLLGRSVYQPTDFTGLRSTFFTHNYVIPGEQLEDHAVQAPSWLHADFQDSYAIEQGTELPVLEQLPLRAPALPDAPGASKAALQQMGIDEKRFKQLLFAVMTAVGGGKKKVYAALDVPIQELPLRARQLLQLIYAALPAAFQRQLGFITYAKEPQSRKSVHLTFVEKGSLRPGDRALEREFVFDLPHDRIVNVNYEGKDQAFLDLAWEHLEQPELARSFAEFCERMLADMEPEHHLSMADYHQLALLFSVSEGDQAVYQANRLAVLRSALSYLKPAEAMPRKPQLVQLMGARFQEELSALQAGRLPEPAVVQVFGDFYAAGGTAIEAQLVRYFLLAIQASSREKKLEEAAAYYRALEQQPKLAEAFFHKVLSDERLAEQLFEPYLQGKLKEAGQIREITQLTLLWLTRHTQLLSSAVFSMLVRTRLAELLAKDRQPLTAAAKAFEALAKFADEAKVSLPQVEEAELSELVQQFEMTVYRTMLTELSWETLTREQLAQAEFLKDTDRVERWNERLDRRQQSSAAVLLAAQRWFVRPKADYRVFDGLEPAEIDRVQQLGRRWLAGQVEPSQFGRITLAFCNSSDVEVIDYPALIEFLRQHAKNPETLYEFFQWSEEHPAYMRPRGFVPAYAAAVLAYFRAHDRDAFKSRARRRSYYDGAGPALKAIYAQARAEQSSPLGKLLRGKRGMLLLSSLVTIGAVLVVLSFVNPFSDKPEVAETPGTGGPQDESPLPGDTGSSDAEWPATLVYADQPGDDQPVAMTELKLFFSVPAACAELEAEDPGTFVIETPDGEEHAFRNMSFDAACGGSSAPDRSGMEEGSAPSFDPEASTDDAPDRPVSTDNATDGGALVDAETPDAAGTGAGSTSDNSTISTETNGGGVSGSTGTEGTNSTLPEAEDATLDQIYPARIVISLGERLDLPEGSIVRFDTLSYELSAAPEQEGPASVEP
ncbi:glycosyltransferase [Paenibacillus sp. 1P07SE]|uniref:GAP1-N2 domain-containing protein n=1 Tax=Paenibacillus sp. 1P07SE TaxID=3132209 RepID=UPI0039A5B248